MSVFELISWLNRAVDEEANNRRRKGKTVLKVQAAADALTDLNVIS